MGSEVEEKWNIEEEGKGGMMILHPSPPPIVVGGGQCSREQNQLIMISVKKSVGFIVAVAITFLLVYHSSNMTLRTFQISSFVFSLKSSQPTLTELEDVLKKAAMDDKTVIITTINEAWSVPNSTFDLFLQSFRIGNQTQWLLNHLIVVALDHKAYSVCLKLHPNCYHLKTAGSNFSREARFMAPDYLKMMWRRIAFLHNVLHLGYNFIFTDVDIMWFRNPFPHFFRKGDFQIACDHYNGNPKDLNNAPNGGFNFVRSNNKTIEFYKFWYKSKDAYPGKHDQDVLNIIKHDPMINKIGLRIKFLDTKYFGGFCQPSKDLNLVCTMHANCCVGLENKLHDLNILLEDWNKYLANQVFSWSVPQSCGAKSFRQRNTHKWH